jgi:hypothetical protein
LWEALVALALARAAIACFPFRRIAAWMGTPGAESPYAVDVKKNDIAREVGWAVATLARRVPWDGRCLVQALAAMGMLRRRSVEGTMSFGARRGETVGFDAHAWLRVGSLIVTGDPGQRQFQTFTTFARRRP